MTKCSGIIGWLIGHNFQPRYDESFSPANDAAKHLAATLVALDVVDVEALRALKQTFEVLEGSESFYICDFCTRCGEHTYRPEPEEYSADELVDLVGEHLHHLGPFERNKFKQAVKDALDSRKVSEVPEPKMPADDTADSPDDVPTDVTDVATAEGHRVPGSSEGV